MKTTFLMLLTLILLVGCATDENLTFENNELVEANATLVANNNTAREASGANRDSLDCYDVYFDPAIYNAESISGIKIIYFQQQNWYAAPNQPANYPYHQVWCAGEPGTPDGTGNTSEGQDLPEGVDVVPQTNN